MLRKASLLIHALDILSEIVHITTAVRVPIKKTDTLGDDGIWRIKSF
jgi:hypothetical protein